MSTYVQYSNLEQWHKSLDIDIKYITGLPNEQEWNQVKSNSLVVLDDLYTEAVNDESTSKAFKIYSKKRRFSIILVTQVSDHNFLFMYGFITKIILNKIFSFSSTAVLIHRPSGTILNFLFCFQIMGTTT